MTSDNSFGGSNRTQGQTGTEDKTPVADALSGFATKIANELVSIIRNEKDLWWFVTEEFDRIRSFHGGVQDVMRLFPLQLHEVEYKWGRIEPFCVQMDNPGVSYIHGQVLPTLYDRFGTELA